MAPRLLVLPTGGRLFTAQRRCCCHCIFKVEAPLSPLTVGLLCSAFCFACAHLSGGVPYGGSGGRGSWAEATDASASQLRGKRQSALCFVSYKHLPFSLGRCDFLCHQQQFIQQHKIQIKSNQQNFDHVTRLFISTVNPQEQTIIRCA